MDDDQNPIRKYYMWFFVILVEAIIQVIVNWLFNSRTAIILLVVFIFINFHFLKKNKSDFLMSSRIIRVGSALLSFVVLTTLAGLLYFPKTGSWIRGGSGMAAPPLPTQYSTSDPTSTFLPPPLPTATKKVVTPTPTLIPVPLIDFKTGCISEAWKPWYGDLPIENANNVNDIGDSSCWDLENDGLTADTSGLRIFQKAEGNPKVFGIFTDLPKNSFNLKIDLLITGMHIQEDDKDTANVFIGFADSTKAELTGQFFVFQIPSNKYFPFVYVEDGIPFQKDSEYIEDLGNYGSGITITGKRDGWSINYVI